MYRHHIFTLALGLVGAIAGAAGSFLPGERSVMLGAPGPAESGQVLRTGPRRSKNRGLCRRPSGVAAARRAAKKRRKARAIASKRRGVR